MKTNLKGYGIIGGMDAAVSKSNGVFALQKLQRTKLAWMPILFAIGFAFFASISLAGCSDGGDPNPNPVDPSGVNKESAITLTLNQWKNGNITKGGEQWFKFTATAYSQYVHFDSGTSGTLYGFNVQVYDNTGAAVGAQTTLNGGTLRTSRTVTTGSVYYIKVTTYNSNVAYKIAFNASSTPPPSITLPTEGVTALTANIWADGTIAADGEQWFKFTATASPQYVHFDPGTLNQVNVRVYDNTGVLIGDITNLYSGTPSMNRTVTPDSEYYIKVMPYSSDGSGAYKITFNASTTPPPSITLPTEGVTTLTLNTWADSTIAADGEQWFKFTATASPQYIHFQPGTLDDVYVQVYDSIGAAIGGRKGLYYGISISQLYTSQAVTPDSEYYIKVTPYSSDGSGAYKITFNTLTTPPITLPTSGLTTLTLDIWDNDNIVTGGSGER